MNPCLSIEVVTDEGRVVPLELRFRLVYVEVWFDGRCCGTLDRLALQAWLSSPTMALVAGIARLTVDEVTRRPALMVPGVGSWTLSPADDNRLRREVHVDADVCRDLREELERRWSQARDDCRAEKEPIELEWLASRIQTLEEVLALL